MGEYVVAGLFFFEIAQVLHCAWAILRFRAVRLPGLPGWGARLRRQELQFDFNFNFNFKLGIQIRIPASGGLPKTVGLECRHLGV